MNYVEGPFHKTLLESIVENDSEGNEFNEHTFEYYDDVQAAAGYFPFDDPEDEDGTNTNPFEQWGLGDDQLGQEFIIADAIDPNHDNASALGTSTSDGFSIGGTIGIGLGAASNKNLTISGNGGYAESDNEGLLAIVDINGDGLPDIVFVETTAQGGEVTF